MLRDSLALDPAMKHKINRAIDVSVPRRFLPNKICAVPEIPRALSGEGQELPIEKLLLDQPIENVVNEDAMANPARLDRWVAFAGKFRQS